VFFTEAVHQADANVEALASMRQILAVMMVLVISVQISIRELDQS
jgi:hypothetical protein